MTVNPPSKPLIELSKGEQERYLVKLSEDVLRAVEENLNGRATEVLEVGYKRAPPKIKEEKKIQCVLVLRETAKYLDNLRAKPLVEHLRHLSRDMNLAIQKFDSTSLRIFIESSLEGLERINIFNEERTLSEKLGVDILEIKRVNHQTHLGIALKTRLELQLEDSRKICEGALRKVIRLSVSARFFMTEEYEYVLYKLQCLLTHIDDVQDLIAVSNGTTNVKRPKDERIELIKETLIEYNQELRELYRFSESLYWRRTIMNILDFPKIDELPTTLSLALLKEFDETYL